MSSSLSEGEMEPAIIDEFMKMKHFSQTKVNCSLEKEGAMLSDMIARCEVLPV